MPRTLIIKLGAIGDVVMAIPAAHQAYLAGHTVDWVCGAAALPVLQLYPWINVIPADDRAILTGSLGARVRAIWSLWKQLAGRRYDVAANLSYDPRYRVLTLPVRAVRSFQLSHTDRERRLLPGRHHTDEYARLLMGWKDEHRSEQLAPVPPPAFPASPLPRTAKRRVVLAPAGAKNILADDSLRRWPADDYVALAALLLARNLELVLIGGPDDSWVQPLFASLPLTDLIGKLPVAQTLALLDEADVLVTHDTGPLHLGGITRVAIVTLFGPTDPRGRLPQRPGALALWGGEGFSCRPCYDGHSFAPCPRNDCIRQYTPATVFAEVMQMLDAHAQGQLPAPRVAVPQREV